MLQTAKSSNDLKYEIENELLSPEVSYSATLGTHLKVIREKAWALDELYQKRFAELRS